MKTQASLNNESNTIHYDTAILFDNNLPNTESILDLLERYKKLKNGKDRLQNDYQELQNEYQEQIQKNIDAKNKSKRSVKAV